MNYEVLLTQEVYTFLKSLDKKTQRVIKTNLNKLKENPYPGRGSGDKERLPVEGEERYRIHIGRTWTAFYSIYWRTQKSYFLGPSLVGDDIILSR